ncbi:hypothetical protein SO694_00006310 [Aureococcus anophagefferens]|uniref:Uncharacterized protein n=1 Tax=Aureococcus anophagefferens TaxID=44056 RepID=A0ABR1GA09_AURAN
MRAAIVALAALARSAGGEAPTPAPTPAPPTAPPTAPAPTTFYRPSASPTEEFCAPRRIRDRLETCDDAARYGADCHALEVHLGVNCGDCACVADTTGLGTGWTFGAYVDDACEDPLRHWDGDVVVADLPSGARTFANDACAAATWSGTAISFRGRCASGSVYFRMFEGEGCNASRPYDDRDRVWLAASPFPLSDGSFCAPVEHVGSAWDNPREYLLFSCFDTPVPTAAPTFAPTHSFPPTEAPTVSPTRPSSSKPSYEPSPAPSTTLSPTLSPTLGAPSLGAPSPCPSPLPTPAPTALPTKRQLRGLALFVRTVRRRYGVGVFVLFGAAVSMAACLAGAVMQASIQRRAERRKRDYAMPAMPEYAMPELFYPPPDLRRLQEAERLAAERRARARAPPPTRRRRGGRGRARARPRRAPRRRPAEPAGGAATPRRPRRRDLSIDPSADLDFWAPPTGLDARAGGRGDAPTTVFVVKSSVAQLGSPKVAPSPPSTPSKLPRRVVVTPSSRGGGVGGVASSPAAPEPETPRRSPPRFFRSPVSPSRLRGDPDPELEPRRLFQ